MLLLTNDMIYKLLLYSSIMLADLGQFLGVSLFLDDFDSLLADVEAHIFGCNTFCLQFISVAFNK